MRRRKQSIHYVPALRELDAYPVRNGKWITGLNDGRVRHATGWGAWIGYLNLLLRKFRWRQMLALGRGTAPRVLARRRDCTRRSVTSKLSQKRRKRAYPEAISRRELGSTT